MPASGTCARPGSPSDFNLHLFSFRTPFSPLLRKFQSASPCPPRCVAGLAQGSGLPAAVVCGRVYRRADEDRAGWRATAPGFADRRNWFVIGNLLYGREDGSPSSSARLGRRSRSSPSRDCRCSFSGSSSSFAKWASIWASAAVVSPVRRTKGTQSATHCNRRGGRRDWYMYPSGTPFICFATDERKRVRVGAPKAMPAIDAEICFTGSTRDDIGAIALSRAPCYPDPAPIVGTSS